MTLGKLWQLVQGKKTYFIALCAVVYGLYASNTDAVLLGLGLFGLRDGLKTEVSKILLKGKR